MPSSFECSSAHSLSCHRNRKCVCHTFVNGEKVRAVPWNKSIGRLSSPATTLLVASCGNWNDDARIEKKIARIEIAPCERNQRCKLPRFTSVILMFETWKVYNANSYVANVANVQRPFLWRWVRTRHVVICYHSHTSLSLFHDCKTTYSIELR